MFLYLQIKEAVRAQSRSQLRWYRFVPVASPAWLREKPFVAPSNALPTGPGGQSLTIGISNVISPRGGGDGYKEWRTNDGVSLDSA
jgi:hypothetical protein